MTPQEKDLIQSVFSRLAQAGQGGRDPEAEALIRDQLSRQPDAPYGLVQAVIIQEIGLNQAQQQIADLQRQLAEARSAAPAAAPAGSFLGAALGSVPNAGARPAWGGQQAAPQVPPQGYAPQPQGYAPQPQAYAPPPQAFAPQPQPGGFAPQGGFLRSAATMAAGVAGGALIAEGISSMFGGHRGGFGGGMGGGSPWGGGQPTEIVENTTVNNYYGDQSAPESAGNAAWDPSQDAQSGYQDAAYDDSGFDGAFDDDQSA